MADWRPMKTAPKDRGILVYGKPEDIEGIHFTAAGVHAVYWDDIDGRFCLKGATWLGPFITPLCWQDEPKPPQMVIAALADCPPVEQR